MLIVESKGFWNRTPYSARAKELTLAGGSVGVLHTWKDKPTLVCNECSYDGVMTWDETEGNFGWGHCPGCDRSYIISFV